MNRCWPLSGVRLLLAAAVLAAATASCHQSAPKASAAADGGAGRPLPALVDAEPAPLSVQGNQLLAGGQPIRLRGVNRSGTEYACIHGWGVFNGGSDAASVDAIVSWHANVVRVLLNEDCWLGINGVPPQYSGQSYQQAIESYVQLLHKKGLYAELSLQWLAPGSDLAANGAPILDEDHGPSFWGSVAAAFKDDLSVFLGLQGEPFGIDYNCWLYGHEACSGLVGYDAAGMQEALTAVRNAGSGNVVAISGLAWANDLSGWLANEPKDSLDPAQLVAEAHVYGNNPCGAANGGACLDSTIAPVASVVPVVFGEVGETYNEAECSADNTNVILSWADAHNISYLVWTWNAWGDCQSLISSEDGTPNTSSPTDTRYASFVKEHLAS